MHLNIDDQQLKELLKQAFFELMQERQNDIVDLMWEVMEDKALGQAIIEGREGDFVDEEEIFSVLREQI
ncbi:hypothetical protein [Thioflexithrix psekupsensis]|uniref:Uncharacterized protein n=1 Tax=Thioflexithrix psekupsensis TaxID=1570016 RepID=A0A251X4A9_9GAMM|nr:hypothetical protein [Thioflexithrix psekupsensis]OUD12195.1 hypothetical protein TPSD3_13820 [Thioflexithrix psekupsensis]